MKFKDRQYGLKNIESPKYLQHVASATRIASSRWKLEPRSRLRI